MKRKVNIIGMLILVACTASAQQFVSTEPTNRVALIEEFTGIRCVGCPNGHNELQYLQGKYPNGEVCIISYNPVNSSLTEPANGSPDFRRPFLNDFYAHAYCAPGTGQRAMPTSFISRLIWDNGDRLQMQSDWEDQVEEVLATGVSPMNIGLRSQYDANAQTITVDVEIYYHTDVTAGNSFYVFLGEHDLTSPYQAGASATPSSPYVYKFNIFRETMTTGTWGDPVTGPTTAGSLFSTQLTFDLADAIDPMNIDKVDVLAFVIEDGSTEVYTAVQTPAIGGSTSVETAHAPEVILFPNPADQFVNITGLTANTEIQLTDATGRILDRFPAEQASLRYDTDHLPQGIYMFSVMTAQGLRTLRFVKN